MFLICADEMAAGVSGAGLDGGVCGRPAAHSTSIHSANAGHLAIDDQTPGDADSFRKFFYVPGAAVRGCRKCNHRLKTVPAEVFSRIRGAGEIAYSTKKDQ